MDDLSGPVAQECVEGYLFVREPFELLIFRRVPERSRFWVPVQGKVEPSDPDLVSAVCREVREETGYVAPPDRVIDLDWHVPFRSETGSVWRLHAFGVPVQRSFEPRVNEEFDAFEWVSEAEAVRRLHFEDNRAAVGRLRERIADRP